MEGLFLAAKLVIPMTVYMLVGFLVRCAGVMAEDDFRKLNTMIFNALIPLSIFFDIYRCDLRATLQPQLILLTAVGLILICAAAWCITSRLVKEKGDAATITQAIYRSNYALFGTTIGASLCGEAGSAIAAVLVAVTVPVFSVLAVILFEHTRGGAANPRALLMRIFKNPLIRAVLLGLVFNLLQIPLPELLSTPLDTLGDVASPLALMVLGGLLSAQSIAGHKNYLCSAVVCRLVLVPLVMVTISILLGYRGPELVSMMAVFGAPAAISSVPMAQAMGGNGKLAGEIVAVSSVCSILSLFCFVVVLAQMGLIYV